MFLPAPGIVGSEAALKVLLDDPYVQQAMRLFDQVTLALVGIGTVQPSSLLAAEANIFSEQEQRLLQNYNAVGDILLRFYDREGKSVKTFMDKRVVSMEPLNNCAMLTAPSVWQAVAANWMPFVGHSMAAGSTSSSLIASLPSGLWPRSRISLL